MPSFPEFARIVRKRAVLLALRKGIIMYAKEHPPRHRSEHSSDAQQADGAATNVQACPRRSCVPLQTQSKASRWHDVRARVAPCVRKCSQSASIGLRGLQLLAPRNVSSGHAKEAEAEAEAEDFDFGGQSVGHESFSRKSNGSPPPLPPSHARAPAAPMPLWENINRTGRVSREHRATRVSTEQSSVYHRSLTAGDRAGRVSTEQSSVYHASLTAGACTSSARLCSMASSGTTKLGNAPVDVNTLTAAVAALTAALIKTEQVAEARAADAERRASEAVEPAAEPAAEQRVAQQLAEERAMPLARWAALTEQCALQLASLTAQTSRQTEQLTRELAALSVRQEEIADKLSGAGTQRREPRSLYGYGVTTTTATVGRL
eukprot:CAMPEP_0174759640 /NCGR_PEP_ID=MMETSP1094-20130205/108372_1 /TAXON_ID=156173 /ORGANISM="Chrysochromulina brevifilum, Strain UTEX LB 985" /LENGTH=375 /DNA_ID=CAMNT_0015965577 /DNA_START=603 /DNA_END=1730 /DNA_ORIENTATION=+